MRAKPVFADIHPRSFNLDSKEIKAKIPLRIKSRMLIRLSGQSAAIG
jgi:dTDP-4-amino-4,6-dideoxygalactose transaminase